jgi:L-lysine 2,3-aminomutase
MKTEVKKRGPGRPRKNTAPSVTDAQTDPAPLRLDEVTLLKMEKLQALMRASESERIMTLASKRALLSKIDPNNQIDALDRKIIALAREKDAAEAEYRLIIRQVEEKFGIDIKEYAYDDKTGTLNYIGKASESELRALSSMESKELPIESVKS